MVKLKHTGVIDSVDVDKQTGKLKICLNQDFCGTIAFCGDLTSYKSKHMGVGLAMNLLLTLCPNY